MCMIGFSNHLRGVIVNVTCEGKSFVVGSRFAADAMAFEKGDRFGKIVKDV